jgi:hypothetical protein
MEPMAKPRPTTTGRVVRDPQTGRLITVRGADALKGRLTIEDGIDLTKPIAAQVLQESRKDGDSA